MKSKSTIGKTISYILSIGCCWLITPLITEAAELLSEEGLGIGWLAVLTVLFLFLAVWAGIFVHEGGHFLFGKLTGYKFLSFRLGSRVFIKKNGNIERKRMTIPGTAGQCVMSPPELKDGHMPYILFNMGGVIAGLVATGISLALYHISTAPMSRLFWSICIAVNAISAITNGIPVSNAGINNDGMNLLELTRDPEAVKALWIQLAVHSRFADDIRVKDMPEEWFTMPEDDKMSNCACATLAVHHADRLLDAHDFEGYAELCDTLLNGDNAIAGLHKSLMACDLMTVYLILGKKAEAEKLYTPAMISFINTMKNYPTVTVARYAHWLIAKKDALKADEAKSDLNRTAKDFPFAGEIQNCYELIGIIDSKVRRK